MDRFASLKAAVETLNLVDAHAHSIVAADSTFPFLSCFSEAEGDALLHAVHTVCFKRGLKEIAELYGTDSSLDAVQEYRSKSGVESITAKCLKSAGVSAILIDDGLELDKKYDTDWHKAFAAFVGRILRVEDVAQKILCEGAPGGTKWTLDLFLELFVKTLKSPTSKVVGFKSICAYRSGLEINTNVSKGAAEEGLNEVLQAGKPVRITNKNFIDYIFIRALEVAQDLDIPMQIHTGFGDKDLDLRLANPLHLRNLLEDSRFSKSRIVLLHSSYPFSKEASYLASVYSQVYLDFGLAVPKLSFHGMLTSVKEILELAPINKVMYSSDAVAFPESFYLGAKKAREILFAVLRDACIDGDLSISEALQAARNILSGNARELYKIKTVDTSSDSNITSLSPSSALLSTNAPVHGDGFVRIYWIDTGGQHRCRAVPQKRFNDFIGKTGITLTVAAMAMCSFADSPAEGSNLSGVGDIKLVPDLSTRTTIPWAKGQEMVLGNMQVAPGTPWEYCPRETLRRVAKVLKDEYNLVMNAGFENEFYLLKPVLVNGEEKWVPFDESPYCSSAGLDAGYPVISEMATSLQSMNIVVEQIHAESGPGQFEVVLGYTDCVNSADRVTYTREVVRSVARKHGLLATFLPKYSPESLGSGSHVHISVAENGENVFMASKSSGKTRYGISKIGEEFMAGVLEHLPSILAFTAPLPNSYARIQPNTWSGAYHCWGMENREAPIRATAPPGTEDGLINNFEIKAFDGCTNAYLSLAAILAAGIDGLRKRTPLPDPIVVNPNDIKDKVKRLPSSLSESVEALEKDAVLKDFIGEKLLLAVTSVRKAEVKYDLENKEAFKKLIFKY